MKKLLPIFISVLIIIFNTLSVNAADNTLRGVDIIKKDADSYTISLTAKYPAKLSKTIVSSDRIILTLKNINVSENLSTKFNKNALINSVMVEPLGNEKVNILVQGDNVAYSNIEFKQPNVLENTEDTIITSVNSIFYALSGNSLKDRAIQFGVILIFLLILAGEIKFIKSKYDELKKERIEMEENINQTNKFQTQLPGYGRKGLKKPYTTPIYGSIEQIHNARLQYLKKINTPETITLNSLLHNGNREKKIINEVVNKKPAYDSLSNININDILTKNISLPKTSNLTSNPIRTDALKENLRHLEKITIEYRKRSDNSKRELELKKIN